MTDHLGSTEALANASGAIVSSTSYDSFGNATSNIATSYRYTGREYDSDTGLYYYRNRWYDPELGRFISKDPIGFAGGDINLYSYVGNNPYGFIDPYGFWRCAPSDPPGGDPPSSWWDAVQGALDVAGLTPVVGLPADLLNAGISVARGNYGDVALSMAAAVPVLGTAAGAGKIAHKLNKFTKGAGGTLTRTFNLNGKQVPLVGGGDPVVGRTLRNGLTEIKTSINGSGNDAANLFRNLVGDSAKPLANGKGFRSVLDDGREVIFRPVSSGRSGGIHL